MMKRFTVHVEPIHYIFAIYGDINADAEMDWSVHKTISSPRFGQSENVGAVDPCYEAGGGSVS